MTKADLVQQVAQAVGPGVNKRDCAMVVDRFLSAVRQALAQGNHIEIRTFGTFKVHERKARTARNPRTGASVQVPKRKVPVFKPSKHMRADVERGSMAPAESRRRASSRQPARPAAYAWPDHEH